MGAFKGWQNLSSNPLFAGFPNLYGGDNSTSMFFNLFANGLLGFSVRKLKSDYNGPCLRIKRASDSVESDIGFAGNFINESEISSFCGVSIGHVVRWYNQLDQTNYLSSPSLSTAPTIYNGSSINKVNNLPALLFNGSSHYMALLTNITITPNAFSIYYTYKQNVTAGASFRIQVKEDPTRFYPLWDNAGTLYTGLNASATSINCGAVSLLQEIASVFCGSSNTSATRNANTYGPVSSFSTPFTSNLQLGCYFNGAARANYYNGNMQECLLLASANTNEQPLILSNINNAFNVY